MPFNVCADKPRLFIFMERKFHKSAKNVISLARQTGSEPGNFKLKVPSRQPLGSDL